MGGLILNGLSHIHGRPYSREGRFVHADIKPDNLFVLISPKKQAYSVFRMPEKGNLVKIIDMGISTESGFTLPGCTPAYSPINKSKARPGVDLYALAICFLELLHGIRPDHNILGHKARIRAFVARRSSGSDFVDELAVEFASRCARAATQSVVSPHRLLDWLHGALFASNILSLIVLHTINKKLSTGLRKDDLADFLFDTFAVYHDWQNKTKVRVGYIKEFIKDLYDTEFLVLTGHSYFIRSC